MISPITDLEIQRNKLVEMIVDLKLKFYIPYLLLEDEVVYKWTDSKAENLYNQCLGPLKYIQDRIDKYYQRSRNGK